MRLRIVEFVNNRQIKVVRLSALRTGRFYPTGDIPGNRFCLKFSMTTSGIESATFRLTARYVGQMRHLIFPSLKARINYVYTKLIYHPDLPEFILLKDRLRKCKGFLKAYTTSLHGHPGLSGTKTG